METQWNPKRLEFDYAVTSSKTIKLHGTLTTRSNDEDDDDDDDDDDSSSSSPLPGTLWMVLLPSLYPERPPLTLAAPEDEEDDEGADGEGEPEEDENEFPCFPGDAGTEPLALCRSV
uniref:Uncharacterized protein n=1 Tax=Anopheles atroparvus TaxID=41427 RepID=A0A182IXN0_ANOAO